jgi:hypothetical protein
MKTADLYYNTESAQVIISGEYEGGTWRATLSGDKWILHEQPKHCRGLLYIGEDVNLLKVLSLTENLKQ